MSFLSKLKEVFVTSVPDTSEPKKLDQTDFAKILRDAVMVAGAAVVTYFSENLTTINFGGLVHNLIPVLTAEQANMILVPLIAGGLSAALKFFKGTK